MSARDEFLTAFAAMQAAAKAQRPAPPMPAAEVSAVCAWRCATAAERLAIVEAAGLPPALADAGSWLFLPSHCKAAIRASGAPVGVREVIAAGFAG